METINRIWAISLFVMGISAILLTGIKIIGIEQQDVAVRILGVVDLIALPVFAFATVRRMKSKR
ncbi:MAG: hypothetical protein LUD00_03015 [Prevotellaceae bacterium]|nr:hypothetical protein [Prevotellaceae bacterium]